MVRPPRGRKRRDDETDLAGADDAGGVAGAEEVGGGVGRVVLDRAGAVVGGFGADVVDPAPCPPVQAATASSSAHPAVSPPRRTVR